MIDNKEFLEKLKLWSQAKISAAQATETESLLRTEIYAIAFPTQAAKQDAKGTFYEDLPNGWKIQAILKMNGALDESAVPSIKDKLTELKVSNVDTLFKYKPSLVAAEYKKLTEESRTIVDTIIVEKPGKVVIELIAPKND